MDKNGIYGYAEFEEGKRRKQRNEKQCFKTCAGIFINDGNAYRCDGMRKSCQIGTGTSEGLTDWGNQELEYYTDEGDVLFATKYGRVEARIKLPEGEGLWPAFWMLPVDDSIYNEWASSGEIDSIHWNGSPEFFVGT